MYKEKQTIGYYNYFEYNQSYKRVINTAFSHNDTDTTTHKKHILTDIECIYYKVLSIKTSFILNVLESRS
jgi:hypothetical protein